MTTAWGLSRFARLVLAGAVTLLIAAGPGSGVAAAKLDAVGRKQHRPHRQALAGTLKGTHVKIVTIKLQGGKGGGGDPGDDYPAALKDRPMDSVLDQWREYNRECTSFVAWALYSRNGFNMPFYANANKWGPDATAAATPSTTRRRSARSPGRTPGRTDTSPTSSQSAAAR